jgi:hypothetical protein
MRNLLSGTLPPSLENLSQLKEMRFEVNEIEGDFHDNRPFPEKS